MDEGFSKKVKTLWNEWELRALVTVSLILQIFLMGTANLRKRRASPPLRITLWLAYLMADYVATLALAILSRGQGALESPSKFGCKKSDASANRHLLSFWAPFLLLHLGGPDTITAFSLEDNQLWLRHGLVLAGQVVVAVYVCIRSLPEERLLVPIILVFLTGTFKYGERTYALKCGSMNGLRSSLLSKPDPGPDYAHTMDGYAAKLRSGLPAPITVDEEAHRHQNHLPPSIPTINLNNRILLCEAYKFFTTFKGLFVDAIFTFKDRQNSRSFFITISPVQAFHVIAFELSFAYDVLYTKASVSRTTLSYAMRGLSLFSTPVALIYFISTSRKGFCETDVGFTFALLGVAILLELVALARLFFSDWTIVIINNSLPTWKCLEKVIPLFNSLKTPRWSNSIGQHNLLSFCVKDRLSRLNKLADLLGAKDEWNNFRYTDHEPFTDYLKNFIFEEMKKKSIQAEESRDYKRFTTCRGEIALEEENYLNEVGWSIEAEFDESLLVWHIATDLCCTTASESEQSSNQLQMAKILSDYLLYLLVVHPLMLSSIAVIGVKRYEDTCAEVTTYLQEEGKALTVSQACQMLLSVNTDLRPKTVKGDKSKSVLWDGCILAKQLKELSTEKRLDIMCKMWVEMLCYAAIHCRGYYHAERLGEGGELITLVWFLMTHLGMGHLYKIESGSAIAQLVSEENLQR